MSSRLLIATGNRGKVQEIRQGLDGVDYEVISTQDLNPVPAEPAEIFQTFAENAILKARYYRRISGHLSLADDSGLVVDALGGRPGVHSARYAGPNASPTDLINKLLTELAGVPWEKRSARFVCAIAISGPGFERVFEGTCEGLITLEQRGAGGFGYDPVFYYPGLERTFAEMTIAEKSSRSHRGRALTLARDVLVHFKDAGRGLT
ncbi:MAG: RdgB/HAM1 family non-canonical purine NTP pyrophosphatase [Acidobacteriota bacterium]